MQNWLKLRVTKMKPCLFWEKWTCSSLLLSRRRSHLCTEGPKQGAKNRHKETWFAWHFSAPPVVPSSLFHGTAAWSSTPKHGLVSAAGSLKQCCPARESSYNAVFGSLLCWRQNTCSPRRHHCAHQSHYQPLKVELVSVMSKAWVWATTNKRHVSKCHCTRSMLLTHMTTQVTTHVRDAACLDTCRCKAT